MRKLYLRLTALSGMLAVGIGAFGAHGLKPLLSADQLRTFQTGVEYHFYHTLALGLVAALLHFGRKKLLAYAGMAFGVGIVLFSGSLYALSIGPSLQLSVSWLGPITPLGGLAFILGWIFLFWASLVSYERHYKESDEK